MTTEFKVTQENGDGTIGFKELIKTIKETHSHKSIIIKIKILDISDGMLLKLKEAINSNPKVHIELISLKYASKISDTGLEYLRQVKPNSPPCIKVFTSVKPYKYSSEHNLDLKEPKKTYSKKFFSIIKALKKYLRHRYDADSNKYYKISFEASEYFSKLCKEILQFRVIPAKDQETQSPLTKMLIKIKALIIKSYAFSSFEGLLEEINSNRVSLNHEYVINLFLSIDGSNIDQHNAKIIYLAFLFSGPNEIIKFHQALLHNKFLNSKIYPKLYKLFGVSLYTDGISINTWNRLTKEALLKLFSQDNCKKIMLPGLKKISNQKKQFLQQTTKSVILGIKKEVFSNLSGLKFEKLLGRTLLFSEKERPQKFIAYKFKKQHEKENELIKQYAMVKYLTKFSDSLKSTLPTPLKIVKVEDLEVWKQNLSKSDKDIFENLVGIETKDYILAYVYSATTDYFQYFYDPSIPLDTLFNTTLNITNDFMFSIFQLGQIPDQLADLFHNRDDTRPDGGRYLIHPFVRGCEGSNGLGKLEKWQESIKYLNIRASGLADEADVAELEDIFVRTKCETVKPSFRYIFQYGYLQKTASFLIISELISNLPLILELVIGKRNFLKAKNTPNLLDNWDIDVISQLKNCLVRYLCITCKITMQTALDYISVIDWTTYAKQMRYWMNPSISAFDLIHSKQVPKELYPEAKQGKLDPRLSSNIFNPKTGPTSNGIDTDLGTVSGINPITMGDQVRCDFIVKVWCSKFGKYKQEGILKLVDSPKGPKTYAGRILLLYKANCYKPSRKVKSKIMNQYRSWRIDDVKSGKFINLPV